MPGGAIGIFYHYPPIYYIRNIGRIHGLNIGDKYLYTIIIYTALVVNILSFLLYIDLEIAAQPQISPADSNNDIIVYLQP